MIRNNNLGNTISNLSKYESNQKSFTAENNSFAPVSHLQVFLESKYTRRRFCG